MTLRGRFLGIHDTAVVKPRLNAPRGIAELPIFGLFLTLASSFATAIGCVPVDIQHRLSPVVARQQAASSSSWAGRGAGQLQKHRTV
jgi:hypothetical protein